ncbi:Cation-independent mannose-6-phosphate receptor [Zootermopsis nevadensis]|uniref:Cation-independent mannose-6-phosphate receptor n=1 Tax=Zootermopsis nevadensis TaxID=136037 RepID=A0A067QUN2_ZOONE|nr:Cation-independent mannose-6-phosphate receptor [Zootermopsis nevadensis]
MPELLIGDVCVYEFMWRTQAACPVNATTEQPHEDDSCTVVVPGTDNRINLRPLRNKVRMVADLAGYNYSFVVCGNLSGSPCGNNGVGVCKFKAQDQSQFWNAGVGNSHLHNSQGAISLKYTDGAPCNDKLKRSTQIVFVCEPSGSERIVFIDKVESCTYIINWYTDLTCNGLQVECSTPAWSDPEPVNLTPLIRLDHNYKVQAQNDTVFYINVCHPLLPVQGLNCPGGSSACVARLHNGNLIEEKVQCIQRMEIS